MINIRIFLRSGHNTQAIGAVGLIDETTEAINVKNATVKYLKQLGHEVIDVTPGPMDSDSDLVYGVSRANNQGGDLFVSIHFNKAFNTYSGALGTESWVYSKSDNIALDEQVAGRITNALSGLGFKNRGIKESADLYELRSTKMASVIVEVCFVEATEDVALYQRLGADEIGKRIAYAISNKPIVQNAPAEVKEVKKVDYIIQYSNQTDLSIAMILASRLNAPIIDCTLPYAYYGMYKTVIAVGEAKNKSGYTNVEIKGSNRADTLKKAIEYLESVGK